MSTEIHHLAAISSDLTQTAAFYCDVLGFRCIRKFSLFGGPKVCHFYWSEEIENFLTFYHCPGLLKGHRGGNTVHSITFSTSMFALPYWIFKLTNLGIAFIQEVDCVTNEPVLCFEDPDGLALRLLFTVNDCRDGLKRGTAFPSFSIKGVHSIQICSSRSHEMRHLLTGVFGLTAVKKVKDTLRFSFDNKPGCIIDVADCSEILNGASGCGMVHHIAFQISDRKVQSISFRQIENDLSFRLQTDHYSSIYFRQAEGILFEIITTKPFLYSKTANTFLGNRHYPKKKEVNKIAMTAFTSISEPLSICSEAAF